MWQSVTVELFLTNCVKYSLLKESDESFGWNANYCLNFDTTVNILEFSVILYKRSPSPVLLYTTQKISNQPPSPLIRLVEN